jgi:hypothetical protein
MRSAASDGTTSTPILSRQCCQGFARRRFLAGLTPGTVIYPELEILRRATRIAAALIAAK